AYLQAFAHGWRMQKQRDNAEQVALIGRRLYERLSKFASLFDDVGKHMDRAVRKYNEAVGSFSVRCFRRAVTSLRCSAKTISSRMSEKSIRCRGRWTYESPYTKVAKNCSCSDPPSDIERKE
ncbi:MAG: DNA recombination protein RmuC, partial [Vulcanimicrobiaceae bacterium]